MERRLSIIIETATGEQEEVYSVAAESPVKKRAAVAFSSNSNRMASNNEASVTPSPTSTKKAAAATGEREGENWASKKKKKSVAPIPKKERCENNPWSSEEMMTLYKSRHEIGSNDWKKIGASGKIPNKSDHQIAMKWQTNSKAKRHNPLEKAFKDVNAKVAKGELVGTVTDYVMDTETREGTWTITYVDGTTEEMKRDELLAAVDVYTKNI